MRYLKNSLAVLLVTGLTAFALYAGVEIFSAISPGTATAATSVATGGQTYVCPQTGCTASTCHAAEGLTPQQAYGTSTGSTTSSGSSANSSSGSSTQQTCPRTGCTASTRHAEEGLSPQEAYGSSAGSSGSSGSGSSAGSGSSQGSGGSSSSGTMTCPRTGCTASTCHAEEGLSPQEAYGNSGGQSFNQ